MLKINKTIANGSAIFSLEGRLDTVTAPDLDKEIKESIEGIKELVLDFQKLDYVSSAGLRVLLSSQKIMNKQGTMKLVNVNSEVYEVLEITGFTDILTIE